MRPFFLIIFCMGSIYSAQNPFLVTEKTHAPFPFFNSTEEEAVLNKIANKLKKNPPLARDGGKVKTDYGSFYLRPFLTKTYKRKEYEYRINGGNLLAKMIETYNKYAPNPIAIRIPLQGYARINDQEFIIAEYIESLPNQGLFDVSDIAKILNFAEWTGHVDCHLENYLKGRDAIYLVDTEGDDFKLLSDSIKKEDRQFINRFLLNQHVSAFNSPNSTLIHAYVGVMNIRFTQKKWGRIGTPEALEYLKKLSEGSSIDWNRHQP